MKIRKVKKTVNEIGVWGGIKAPEMLFVVLCKSGKPHLGAAPEEDYESAVKLILDVESRLPTPACGPHRPQAYRPMI